MARQKLTDEARQQFIDLHFAEYEMSLKGQGKKVDDEWGNLPINKKYDRIRSWLNNKNKSHARNYNSSNYWTNKGKITDIIKSMDFTDIERLKGDIMRFIDEELKRKKGQRIKELENERTKADKEHEQQIAIINQTHEEKINEIDEELNRLKA